MASNEEMAPLTEGGRSAVEMAPLTEGERSDVKMAALTEGGRSDVEKPPLTGGGRPKRPSAEELECPLQMPGRNVMFIVVAFVTLVLSLHVASTQQRNHTSDNSNQNVCDCFFGGNYKYSHQQDYAYDPSGSSVWKSLRGRILKASRSYFTELEKVDGESKRTTDAKNAAFHKWIGDVFEFHTENRLRKTRVHPPNSHAIRKLMQVIENRIAYLDNIDIATKATSTEEQPPPLQIAVLGGSVTKGFHCEYTPMGLVKFCDWTSMLEKMFNEVFFGGKMVVKVSNAAIGGSISSTGVLIMEYGLLKIESTPHIVIDSYAPNEEKRAYGQANNSVGYVNDIQSSFIHAANNLRPCDDHLPLVVIADHMYGREEIEHADRISGKYSGLAKWFDIMAFDESNVAYHEVVYNYLNDTAVELFAGSKYEPHFGYGLHLSIAWTALFNFLDAFVDNCNDFNGMQSTTGTSGDNDSSDLESVLKAPSLKYLPALSQDLKVPSLVEIWNQEAQNRTSQCSEDIPSSYTKHANFMFLVFAGGVDTQEDLRNVLEPVLKWSRGWEVKGNIQENP